MQSQETESISTTWSEPEDNFDKRTYRRYLAILVQLEWAGKILLAIFVIIFIAGTTSLLLLKNFEQVIFTDGSELTCVYDTETGKIRLAE
ncbi:hypothetical protein [Paralysiella testudinis]|uniref:Uncharacterized protein n=1 Tax=Paralysiella testudinis TaxID=2809020 RepID=A0A892ZHI2_9NEIS|nr:hypothetical protein [Paralysiella testudinis]QRQ83005.1 hypothetical protein JQU52_06450 [Paralysiella testudinis]